MNDTHVAQSVERAAVNRVYGGSNPSVGAFDLLSSANGLGDLVLSQEMWVQLPPRALRNLLPSSNRQDFRFSVGERGFKSLRECLKFQRVAQFGSARASGARGRRFKSFHADLENRVGGRAAIAAACRAAGLWPTGVRVPPCAFSDTRTDAPEVLQWRNTRLQTERWQVRSLHGVLS